MKISKTKLNECVKILMSAKLKEIQDANEKATEEIRTFVLEELKAQAPVIFEAYTMLKEKSLLGIFLVTRRYCAGFHVYDFYIDYAQVKIFAEEKYNYLTSLRTNYAILKDKLFATLQAMKREDILEEFPVLKEILEPKSKVCTSLSCIKSIKEELKPCTNENQS